MTWQKFAKVAARLSPFLSIRTSGQIGFSTHAIKKYGICSQYVVLFYDEDRKWIGIKEHVNRKEPGAVRITAIKGTAFMNVNSFLNYYGIDFSVNRKYAIRIDKQTGYLVSDLKEPQ